MAHPRRLLRFDAGLMLLRRAIVTMAAVIASFATLGFGGQFVTLWFGGQFVTIGVAPAILAVVFVVTFARAEQRGHSSGLGVRVAAIPVIAAAATGVSWLLQSALPLGAVVFIAGLSLAIYVRRWGPRATRLGTVISLPFVAILIVPVHLPALFPAWLTLTASITAALVAVLWVEITLWVGRVTGVLSASTRYTGLPVARPTTAGDKAAGERGARGATAGAASSRRHAAALPSTRMALHLATALAAAFIVGTLVFPGHWAWVVLTAYIVCSANRGRGDVVYKSVLRVVGAIAGTVAVSALSATALASPSASTLDSMTLTVVVFAVLFVALWLRDLNYAWWAACVTVILALIQTDPGGAGSAVTAGLGTPMLLAERVTAIVVGALCGVVASWFVLPVRTDAVVRRRVRDALAALQPIIQHPGEARRDTADLRHFASRLTLIEQVAPPLRASRQIVRVWDSCTRRQCARVFTADLADAVLALGPAVSRFAASAGPSTRTERSVAARTLGQARRALASRDTAEAVAATDTLRALLEILTREPTCTPKASP